MACASDENHNMIIGEPVNLYFAETYEISKEYIIYKYKDLVKYSRGISVCLLTDP